MAEEQTQGTEQSQRAVSDAPHASAAAPGGTAATPTFAPDVPALPNAVPTPPPKPKKARWLLPTVIGVLVVVVVAGIWVVWHRHSVAKTQSDTKLTKISVRLEWVNNPEFTGMYVAQEKGYYKAEGLDVNLKEFQDNTDVNKEVATGAVDYGVSTPLEVVLARDTGEDNKAIAAIYQTSPYAIVAQKKANINTPSDFKGKILGDSGNNNEARVTYAALLGKAGIDPSETTIKSVDFDILKVFGQNQADTYDLYRTDQTYLLNQAHIPYTEIFPEQYGFAIYGDVLIASDAKIAAHRAQTAAFVRATLRGWQYAPNHPAESLAILARHDNVLYKDPNYVKYDLTNTLPLIRPTESQPLGSMQYVPWNRAYLATRDAGLLHNPEDNPTDLYTTEFVH